MYTSLTVKTSDGTVLFSIKVKGSYLRPGRGELIGYRGNYYIVDDVFTDFSSIVIAITLFVRFEGSDQNPPWLLK